MHSFLKGCSRNFKNFFSWSEEYLKKHEKKAIIVNKGAIQLDGCRCGGWCDENEIVVARKNPLFEKVYVHEFSHMNQLIENSKYWVDDLGFWDKLSKQKLQISSWEGALTIIALERDCERRSLAHSKKWELFDNEAYAQRANLYLYYYQYVFLKQKWVNSTSIYHPKLVNSMPKKLLPLSQFKTIDMQRMNLFEDCLDKKGKYFHKLV
jgi:hypothetical protein